MKNIFVFLIFFFFINNICSAQGIPVRSGILPEMPTANTPLRLGIEAGLIPCLGTGASYPTFYHLSNDNHITFVLVGRIVSPCPNIGGYGLQYDIGQLPAGDYTVQIYVVSGPLSIPQSINDPLGVPLDDGFAFTVQGADVVSVPAFGFLSIVVLTCLMMILALKNIRKRAMLVSIILLMLPLQAFSNRFILLLSNEPGTPSAETVVSSSTTSPRPDTYVLETFNEYRPDAVGYLLPDRPYGQRLDLINQYPDWLLSQMYRYIVVRYPESFDVEDLLSSFSDDNYVISASDLSNIVGTTSSIVDKNNNSRVGGNFIGDFINDLDINMAWQLSEGMGYIGIIDNGISTQHSAFKAFEFDGQNYEYLGGNLLDHLYQLDLASGDLNVDEAEPLDIEGNEAMRACDLADGLEDDMASTWITGHGTHVAGIIAAKDENVSGICKNCGLGVMKWYRYASCLEHAEPPTLFSQSADDEIARILETMVSFGYGTVNWSGGLLDWDRWGQNIENDEFFCLTKDGTVPQDHKPFCDALQMFKDHNVMMVSSAGNNRVKLQFPASETQTVAVGGLTQTGTFWNESPGQNGVFDFSDNSGCPFSGPQNECGSNISNPPIDQKVDVMTQATAVYSTFYEGGRWAESLGCADESDGIEDGYGYCSGTSMSSPQVAAMMQLMRSTNPLLPNGTYDPNIDVGLINVLNRTSSRSISKQGVNDYLGYGVPSASLAIAELLGYSNGQLMRTRLTPMFEIISDEANNHVYTPFPQLATSFLIADGADYEPNSNVPTVKEFTSFWHGTNFNLSAPTADFYVFTTNNNPFTNIKNMVPLRRMEKTSPGTTNRNDTYAVNETEIEMFKNEGYNYAGIEGYILPPCSPVTSCAPLGATRLFRDETDSMNHKLITIPDLVTLPPLSSVFLGFVYMNKDTDSDGLIDGQEIILGTNIQEKDTDGDRLFDGVEYPPAGIPYGDPMISDIIFEHGFE